MSKVNIENLTYKKPDLFAGLNQLIGVSKDIPIEDIPIDPDPDPDPPVVPGDLDDSTGTGGQGH